MRRPPRLAVRLLRFLAGPELSEYVEGDLTEEFNQRASASPLGARVWYWRQVLSLDLVRLRREAAWNQSAPSPGWHLDWLQDVKVSVRSLVSRPAFATVVAAVLALGIALFTTLFGIVHAVLLEPLPFQDPDRLVVIWEDGTPIGGGARWSWSRAFYDALREETTFHEAVAASFPFPASLLHDDVAESIPTARVSPRFFDVFGVPPRLGRTFAPDDRRAVVLSHDVWRQSLGGDPAIVGADLAIEDLNPLRNPGESPARELYTVIGVMPPEFRVPMSFARPGTPAGMWIPFHPKEAMPDPFTSALNVVARLRSDVSLAEAHADAASAHENIQRRFPDYDGRDVKVVSLYDDMVGDVRPMVWLLAVATTFVVLIVLANLGNLFVTRGLVRSGELALRTALGATRARLARLVLMEAALVCAAGASLGAALAMVLLPFAVRILPAGIPRLENAHLGAAPLMLAIGVATTAAVLFTFLSMVASRAAIARAANGFGRSTARTGRRLQNASILIQTTVTVLLLVASGLSIQSLDNLLDVDPGFDSAPRMTFQLRLPQSRYPTDAAKIQAVTEMHRRIEAIPGVVASGSSDQIPPNRGGSGGEFVSPMRREAVHMGLRTVTHHYLEALGLEPVEGRPFRETDDVRSNDVVLVSESAARVLYPNVSPIGRTVSPEALDADSAWPKTIVGVLPDLPTFHVSGAPFLEIYQLHEQAPWGQHKFVVQTEGDALSYWTRIRDAVRSVDRELPHVDVKTLDELVARSIAQPVFLSSILGLFTAAALVLSAVGTFGVLSYVAAQRLREVAIRLAVGASPRRIVVHFVWRVAALTVAGIASGTLLAFLGRSFLRAQLYDVSAADPTSYVVATVVALGASLMAALPVAKKAASTDPAVVLRLE